MSQLGGDALPKIATQLGAGKKETAAASGAAVTTILAALARNAERPGGADALNGALEKDHDGGLLNDLGGYLKNSQIGNGDGILKHLLGGKRPVVERSVSKASGLDSDQTGKLLAMLAPIVMGALGKQKRQQGMSANALTQLLGQERQQLERSQPAAGGILSSMLDSDGDGDVDASDLLKHGSGLLGKLFNR
jgi:hypothetical protein